MQRQDLKSSFAASFGDGYIFLNLKAYNVSILVGRGRQKSADSVENSRPWFAQRKSTRPRLKSLILAEASRTQISRSSVQKRRFNQSMPSLFGRTDFFNRIGQ
jgi:hypothetical protein